MIFFDKYGFALFDKNINDKENIKNNKMSGMACIYTQDKSQTLKVFKFNYANELDKNIIWYSNLDKSEMWRTGLSHIKSNDFLGIPYQTLFDNIIFINEKENITISFAKLFAYTMFSYEYFLSQLNIQFDVNKLGDCNLYEHTYQTFMLKSFNPNTNNVYRHYFEESYIEKIKNTERNSKDNLFSFLLESNYYINTILKNNIPYDDWRNIEDINLNFSGMSTKNKINFLLSHISSNIVSTEDKDNHNQSENNHSLTSSKPLHALIKIDNLKSNPTSLFVQNSNIEQDLQSDLNLWQGSRALKLNGTWVEDFWITETEFQFLSKKFLADEITFDILDVKLCYSSKNLFNFYFSNLFKKELYINKVELRKLSIVSQIIERTFFKSFISSGYFPLSRKKFLFTENMIWFRAKERELLFNLSSQLQKEFGYFIQSYGNGEICINFTKSKTYSESERENNKLKLINFLIQHHFIIPTTLCLNYDVKNFTKLKEIKLDNQQYQQHIIDFKIKCKYLQNKELIKEEDYFHFINRLFFNFNNKKEELSELLKLFTNNLSFTKEEVSNNPEYNLFLTELKKYSSLFI